MAISGKAQMEYGVAASNGNTTNSIVPQNPTSSTVVTTVYGKITIPIGAPKSRIDCDRLYQLEVRRRELEIKLLEMQTNPDQFKPAAIPK